MECLSELMWVYLDGNEFVGITQRVYENTEKERVEFWSTSKKGAISKEEAELIFKTYHPQLFL